MVFLDPDRPCSVSGSDRHFSYLSFTMITFTRRVVNYMCIVIFFLKQMEKLKRQLAEAEAAVEARKKPPEDTGPRIVGEGLVIDEWVYLVFPVFGF